MLEWIDSYVKSLVSMPDRVSLSRKDGVKSIVINIKVASEDRALFEGRNNRLLWALKSTAALAGAKPRVRYVVKVSD